MSDTLERENVDIDYDNVNTEGNTDEAEELPFLSASDLLEPEDFTEEVAIIVKGKLVKCIVGQVDVMDAIISTDDPILVYNCVQKQKDISIHTAMLKEDMQKFQDKMKNAIQSGPGIPQEEEEAQLEAFIKSEGEIYIKNLKLQEMNKYPVVFQGLRKPQLTQEQLLNIPKTEIDKLYEVIMSLGGIKADSPALAFLKQEQEPES